MAMSHAGASVGFGAVGDSLSDEYRFYPPDRSLARNWVEILAQARKLDFGAYTTASRGEPRNQGYAYDWARSDADSQGVVGGQLPGLEAQVAAGKVTYASVNMGSNDFLHFLEATAGVATTTGVPSNFGASLYAIERNAQADFDITTSTLLAASPNARLAVATITDLHEIPAIEPYLGIAEVKDAVDLAEDAVEAENAHIRAFAAANPTRVGLVDLAAVSAAVAGRASVPFGGTTISLATSGDDYHDFILGDGIHPGTVAQGLIADAFLGAVDGLGAGVAPLSPAEVVGYAARLRSHLGSTP